MRRRLPFVRLVLGLSVTLVVTAVVGLTVVRFDRVVIAPGRLAGGSISVRAPRTGRIDTVLVTSAEQVGPHQLLVRLESDELEADAERLRLRIANLDQRVGALREERRRLSDEVHPSELQQANRAAERARLELAQAEVKALAIANLGREGLAGRLEVEEAELAHQLAAMNLEEAEQAIPALVTEHRARLSQIATEVRSVSGEIAEERTRHEEFLRRIAQSEVEAGEAGVVIAPELHELTGRHVAEGDELLRVAVAPAARFEGALSDSGRALARTGLPAKIRLEGYPWLIHGTLGGRVERLSDRRDAAGGFPVTVAIDGGNPPGALYEGMRGTARIVIEERVTLGRLLIERVTGTEQR